MADSPFIKFLGTAGARFVVAKQLRSSAGTYIEVEGKKIMLDPGPGTLVRCAKSKPAIDVTKLDAIILTHAHIDHSNDVNILIDAMTDGGLKKRGTLFATEDCLEGENAVVLRYLKDFPREIVRLETNREYRIGELTFFTSMRHRHSVETYGIIFNLGTCKVSFMVDTRYFPELLKSYEDSRILVMNVVRYTPHKSGNVMHLCFDDVKQIITRIKPQKAIITHFGMTMLNKKPWELAKKLTEESGVEVIAASDGMRLPLSY